MVGCSFFFFLLRPLGVLDFGTYATLTPLLGMFVSCVSGDVRGAWLGATDVTVDAITRLWFLFGPFSRSWFVLGPFSLNTHWQVEHANAECCFWCVFLSCCVLPDFLAQLLSQPSHRPLKPCFLSSVANWDLFGFGSLLLTLHTLHICASYSSMKAVHSLISAFHLFRSRVMFSRAIQPFPVSLKSLRQYAMVPLLRQPFV